MNISVPDNLKKRMDKYKGQTNWSAIACQAFEDHLRDLSQHSRKGDVGMEGVINRLRGSKEKTASEDHAIGQKAGYEWAAHEAEYNELKRLSARRGNPRDWCFGAGTESGYDDALYFHRVIFGDDELWDRGEAEEFWNNLNIGNTRDLDSDLVQGFAEGAMELWDQVQHDV